MYLAIAGPVLGASFDCAKASIQVEKAICSSASLSALDVALNEQYRALKSKVDADALQTDQRAWIQRRNRCAGEDCLTDEYRRRAAELSSWLTPDNQMPRAAVHETGRANFILNPTTQENDPMRSSDCIALTPIGDDVLRFDLELVGGNGHMCEMHGKAEASDEDGVYVHTRYWSPTTTALSCSAS
nr:lysozyme inhibitor LprI family protein [Panacagrimonas sp.]